MSKGKVSKVIDGDTFKIVRGPFIRLENVDAPEKGRKGGAQATRDLENLIGGKTVSYNPVGKSYGRTVAKVKVAGKSVNNTMRRKGYK
jgi:micrococcal nuclease